MCSSYMYRVYKCNTVLNEQCTWSDKDHSGENFVEFSPFSEQQSLLHCHGDFGSAEIMVRGSKSPKKLVPQTAITKNAARCNGPALAILVWALVLCLLHV